LLCPANGSDCQFAPWYAAARSWAVTALSCREELSSWRCSGKLVLSRFGKGVEKFVMAGGDYLLLDSGVRRMCSQAGRCVLRPVLDLSALPAATSDQDPPSTVHA